MVWIERKRREREREREREERTQAKRQGCGEGEEEERRRGEEREKKESDEPEKEYESVRGVSEQNPPRGQMLCKKGNATCNLPLCTITQSHFDTLFHLLSFVPSLYPSVLHCNYM